MFEHSNCSIGYLHVKFLTSVVESLKRYSLHWLLVLDVRRFSGCSCSICVRMLDYYQDRILSAFFARWWSWLQWFKHFLIRGWGSFQKIKTITRRITGISHVNQIVFLLLTTPMCHSCSVKSLKVSASISCIAMSRRESKYENSTSTS